MTRRTTKQRTLPLALTALAALPIAGAWTPSAASAATLQAAKTRTFKGPAEDVPHGPVQVSIIVKNKKITGVKVTNSPEGPRSDFIQGQAIPILKQETLRAQSAKINEVSGATDTSAGYITSLQAAVKSARQHKAFK
ncbi:MAG: FMN-binding protein [Chloroflexota bacterium]